MPLEIELKSHLKCRNYRLDVTARFLKSENRITHRKWTKKKRKWPIYLHTVYLCTLCIPVYTMITIQYFYLHWVSQYFHLHISHFVYYILHRFVDPLMKSDSGLLYSVLVVSLFVCHRLVQQRDNPFLTNFLKIYFWTPSFALPMDSGVCMCLYVVCNAVFSELAH